MTDEEYKELIVQAESLIDRSLDDVSNMANLSALLMQHMKLHWVGFYRVSGKYLHLGPFQGPVACTKIELGKGVCGTAWLEKRTIIVDNVHEFPGHIACSALSNSEIVVPCFRDNEIFAVLDLDSIDLNYFNQTDKKNLEQIVKFL